MKKRSILGKIALFLLFPLFLTAASVKITVDKPAIYPGDTVSFTIVANGKKEVKFPDIKDIEGFPIIGTSNSQSTIIINNEIKKTFSKTYTFSPSKEVEIPSFEVEIDGKIYKTNPVKIKILTPQPSSKNQKVSLEIKASKKELYVGEPVKVDIIFKKRADVKIDKVEIEEPKFENFWVKRVNGVKKGVEGEYITQTYSFIIFPQKSGKLKINPISAKIGSVVKTRRGGIFDDPFFNDPFFNNPFFQSFSSKIKWEKIFSNSLEFNVKPLPDSLEIYGDFIIEAKADKTTVKANKPVNLTIQIAGEGNIDDIKKFDIEIPNAVVYADDPKISTKIENDKYVGTFTQKIAIIADRSFTIPPIEFRYFDKNLKKEVVKKTKPIKIKVIGSSQSTTPLTAKTDKIEKNKKQKEQKKEETKKDKISSSSKEENPFIKYLFMIIGYLLGALSILGVYKFQEFKQRPKKELPVIKKIKKSKTDKELFKILLPYAKESEFIKKVLEKLEKNIYDKENNKIDKEELIEYFEEKEFSNN